MVGIDNSEAWKQIPPEEKIELMARSHASGVMAVAITIVICSTIALALKISWIMWASIILSPMVFQFAAGKSWRDLRPRIMLEYLAARSAARRFAFTEGAKDLQLNLIFRGKLEHVFEREDIEEALQASIEDNAKAEVWIALFKDTLIMLNERPGGAGLALGQNINDRLAVESSDDGQYTNSKEVLLTARDKVGGQRKYKVTSKYPGALAVFEKRLLQLQSEVKKQAARTLESAQQAQVEEEQTLSGF
jgi:hypothetical protein